MQGPEAVEAGLRKTLGEAREAVGRWAEEGRPEDAREAARLFDAAALAAAVGGLSEDGARYAGMARALEDDARDPERRAIRSTPDPVDPFAWRDHSGREADEEAADRRAALAGRRIRE